jgi:GH24 family phage-related lysozyme (muramidase)
MSNLMNYAKDFSTKKMMQDIEEKIQSYLSEEDKPVEPKGMLERKNSTNEIDGDSVVADSLADLITKASDNKAKRYRGMNFRAERPRSSPEEINEFLANMKEVNRIAPGFYYDKDDRNNPMDFSGSIVKEDRQTDALIDVAETALEQPIEIPTLDIAAAIEQDQVEQQDTSTLKGSQAGLMAKPSSAVDLGIDNKKASRNLQPGIGEFYTKIAEKAETDHGSTPVITNDAGEAAKKDADKSRDIGYGHKITATENTSGKIYGIPFKDLKTGNFISLTNKDKVAIYNADMEMHTKEARNKGWDTKLANINTSWDKLDTKYTRVLSSLAFNVGGHKAGPQWTAVLKAAKDKDVTEFAKQLRRKDAGKYTAGLDNRVAKELYYSKLIDKLSDVSSVLPKANATVAGIPK